MRRVRALTAASSALMALPSWPSVSSSSAVKSAPTSDSSAFAFLQKGQPLQLNTSTCSTAKQYKAEAARICLTLVVMRQGAADFGRSQQLQHLHASNPLCAAPAPLTSATPAVPWLLVDVAAIVLPALPVLLPAVPCCP
eukprot:GHRQ01025914.1.p2 GENE.GHRQ01025914.1~~GHRQ01025914.1.p2  ORF type:complete len:139 (+),score=35.77 GHRQ01025914.1:562-978(+)